MCILRENLVNKEKEPRQQNTNWSQLFRKPLKPKLTRKIVSKAKINLNKYWNKFEELLNNAETDIKSLSAYKAFSLDSKPAKLPLLSAMQWQAPPNNLQSEINTLMAKSFRNDEPNNLNRSEFEEQDPSYTTFNDDELCYGVNLNATPRPANQEPARCACCQQQMSPSAQLNTPRFSHRNIQLTFEDCQNLENEAMEVYTDFGYYDTSF